MYLGFLPFFFPLNLYFSISFSFYLAFFSLAHTHTLSPFHNFFSVWFFSFIKLCLENLNKYLKWMMTYWKHKIHSSCDFLKSLIQTLSKSVFEFWLWIIVFRACLGNMTRTYQSALASGFSQQNKIGNYVVENQLLVAGLHLLGLQTLKWSLHLYHPQQQRHYTGGV